MCSHKPPKRQKHHVGFQGVVQNLSDLSWREQREAQWEKAIRRWRVSTLTWNPDVRIVAELLRKEEFKSQAQILVDIFFNKALSTLLKQCNSLARLVNHLNKAGGCFPCTEQELIV